jgi:chlorite dismutase
MVMNGYEDYQKQQGEFNSNAPQYNTKMYYWVFAVKSGKYVNIGYKMSESEAYQMAITEVGDKMYEIFPSNTSDISEVNRRFKKHILEKSHNLDKATSLISRKPAEEKKKKEKHEWGELW